MAKPDIIRAITENKTTNTEQDIDIDTLTQKIDDKTATGNILVIAEITNN